MLPRIQGSHKTNYVILPRVDTVAVRRVLSGTDRTTSEIDIQLDRKLPGVQRSESALQERCQDHVDLSTKRRLKMGSSAKLVNPTLAGV